MFVSGVRPAALFDCLCNLQIAVSNRSEAFSFWLFLGNGVDEITRPDRRDPGGKYGKIFERSFLEAL
jgi:hypothetical protein